MKSNIDISHVMSRDILTVSPDEKVVDVAKKMSKLNVGSAIVIESKIVGIVTERDFLHNIGNSNIKIEELTVESVMTDKVLCIDIEESLEVAGKIMGDNYFRHLPVTKNGFVVGILSARDIFKAFHNHDVIKIKQLEAVKALAVTYAHEINNPLSIISSALYIVKKDVSHESLDVADANIKRICDVLQKLSELKDVDLDEYSKESKLIKIS